MACFQSPDSLAVPRRPCKHTLPYLHPPTTAGCKCRKPAHVYCLALLICPFNVDPSLLCLQELRQHIESLRPAVEELARMETEAQGNFLRFQTQWLPSVVNNSEAAWPQPQA